MNKSISKLKQSGHAALLFAMIAPVLFGVFTLGTDGARALQDKARLSEASEVASLAISAVDASTETVQRRIFTDYIQYYFPHSTVDQSSINVERIICSSTSTECPLSSGEERYIKYQVTGSISSKSWFPGNNTIVGFGDTYDVAGLATAKKYQSNVVDVTYVVDHSSSMLCSPGEPWSNSGCTQSNSNSRYNVVKEIIDEVNTELEEFDSKNIIYDQNNNVIKSQIAYAGFNSYAHQADNSEAYAVCDIDYRVFNTKQDWFWINGQWRKKTALYDLNYATTASVSNIFDSVKTCRTQWSWLGNDYYYNHGYSKIEGTFYNLSLSYNYTHFSSAFDTFKASGCTNSVQGLIQGARVVEQALKNGTGNSKQLIIIISDGMDVADGCGDSYGTDAITTSLVKDYGLCENIRTRLDSYTVSGQGDVETRIALVGFSYLGSEGVYANQGLTSCVGNESNIYSASSGSELKTAILGLISEEYGRLITND